MTELILLTCIISSYVYVNNYFIRIKVSVFNLRSNNNEINRYRTNIKLYDGTLFTFRKAATVYIYNIDS